jgi:hypothetical protein
MHKFWKLTLGSLAFFYAASSLGAAPQFGRQRGRQAQVCLYQDIQYRGAEQCFNAGDTVSTLQNMNGQPSSIRIYGDANVTVYDATNFRGHSTVFTSSVPDLGRVRLESKTWNDRIQSLQINGGNADYGGYGNYPNQYPNQQVSQGICVYDRPNYQGRSQCWSSNEALSDLGQQGNWSDRISSIRVFGRTSAVVYRDIGFRGGSFVVDRDIPSLSQISGSGFRNWDRQISSIEIGNGRANNGYGRNRSYRRNRDRDRYEDRQ